MLEVDLLNDAKDSLGAVGVAGGYIEVLLAEAVTGRSCSFACAEIDRPLGSGGIMHPFGVWGDKCCIRSLNGLAGDRGLSLAFDLFERKSSAKEDVLRSGVGDFTFLKRREWVKERVIEERFLNLRAVDGESSIKPSLSPSTLPDGVPTEMNLQSCSF